MLASAYIFAASGCQNKGTVTERSMPIENQNEKIWSEKDIDTMFSQDKESDWGYVGCVLVSDYASDWVGAVLFWDNSEKASNVAFFNAMDIFNSVEYMRKCPLILILHTWEMAR